MSKQQTEAELIGLTLLNKADLSYGKGYQNYNLYKFNNCGHDQYLQPTHVRRNTVKCRECLNQEYKSRGETNGFTFVSLAEDLDHMFYKRNICGHVLKIRVQAVGKRTKRESNEASGVACSVCYDEKLKLDAEKIGMTYLGAALHRKGVFRHYLFNSCGHKRDVNACCVAKSNVVCQECIIEKYKQEAIAAGITYNGEATDKPNMKRNYILECGHTKDIRLDHVRNGSWVCTFCGDSHYLKPSKIYLLKITTLDFTWLKLGYAKDIKYRTNSYGLAKGATVEVLFNMDIKNGLEALHVEKKLHLQFKSFRINANIMKKYHKHNGFTECYNIDIQDDLLNVLNNILKESNEQ
jgi:hypothetical protein